MTQQLHSWAFSRGKCLCLYMSYRSFNVIDSKLEATQMSVNKQMAP